MSEEAKDQSLELQLRAVWQRLQRGHFFAGLLALCRWGVPILLLGIALDWLFDFPTVIRVGILAALLGFSLVQAWRQGC